MELITVGQIAAGIALLVGLVKGIEYLCKKISAAATKWLHAGLEPTNKKLDDLDKKLVNVDLNQCKNFLVRFLADVDEGNAIDEVEKERFYETYEHYESIGGNSYIHDKVEKLKKAGKL